MMNGDRYPRRVPTAAVEALLIETFGFPFLEYVSATDEPTLRARLEGTVQLPAQVEQALEALVPIAEHVAAEAAKSKLGSPSFHLQMFVFPSETQLGVWNELRLAAGGALPQVPEIADDELASLLLQVALVQYPSYLLPDDPSDPFPPRGFNLFRHPSQPRLVQLIGSDERLSRLFTDDDPGLGKQGFVYTSLGHGFGLQSVMLGEMLLRAGWDGARMWSSKPTFDSFCTEALNALEVVRSVAIGEPARIRALVAFTGVLPGDREISTPWGSLRAPTEVERQAAPASVAGAVTGTDADGNQVTVSYAGEMVLETELQYSVLVRSPQEIDHTSWEWPDLLGADDLRHVLEAVELSTLFTVATPPGSVVIARPSWAWIGDPLTHGRRVRSWDVRSGPGFTPYQLSAAECDEFGAWCERVHDHRTPAIDIAIRRVMSAAQVRTDPADRLVDSVIVWENLFGTREGEVTLRVSLAMAWLLEPASPPRRQSLQRRLKALYAARSDIVHGNPYDPRRVADLANEAFACSVRALAALFRDHPDLLAYTDGGARGLRLMLAMETVEDDACAAEP